MRDQKVKLLAKVANDLCFEAARLKVYEKEHEPRYAEIQQEYIIVADMLSNPPLHRYTLQRGRYKRPPLFAGKRGTTQHFQFFIKRHPLSFKLFHNRPQ